MAAGRVLAARVLAARASRNLKPRPTRLQKPGRVHVHNVSPATFEF